MLAAAAVLAAGGCEDLEALDAADVTITPCPPDLGPCPLIADGVARIPLRVTVSVPEPHPTLKAKLRLSRGSFVAPTDPTRPAETEVALAVGDAALATIIATDEAGWLRVDADVGGLVVPAIFALAPADVDAIELTPSPGRLGDAAPIAVAVAARAAHGHLSRDTVATASITAQEPAGAFAQLFPRTGVLDGDGHLALTLHKEARLTSVTIAVTVTPPTLAGVAPGAPLTSTLVLTAP